MCVYRYKVLRFNQFYYTNHCTDLEKKQKYARAVEVKLIYSFSTENYYYWLTWSTPCHVMVLTSHLYSYEGKNFNTEQLNEYKEFLFSMNM